MPVSDRTDVQLRPDKLDQPLRWTRPRRIFVNSMFLFKQWGDPTAMHRAGKRRAGRELYHDGRTFDEYPGGTA